MLRNWIKSYHLLLLSVILSILLRLPFCLVPVLFMDEAQILAFGGKLLYGGSYGIDIVDTRGPGSYYISAIIAYFFGYGNIIAYHIIGLLFNIAVLLLIFFLASLLFNKKVAQLSCLFFVVFSYSYKLIDTLAFNVETIALPFLMLSSVLFYSVISNLDNGIFKISLKSLLSFLMVGVLCAIVFSIKQVLAACLMAYFVIILVEYYFSRLYMKQVLELTGLLAAGFLLGLMAIYGKTIIITGWENTVYWSYIFGYRHYAKPITASLVSFINPIFTLYLAQPLFWVLSLVWLVKSASSFIKGFDKNIISDLYLFLLVTTQILGAIIPGRKAFHYIVPIIPFLSIAVSKTIKDYSNLIAQPIRRPLIFLTVLIAILPPLLNYTLWPAGLQALEYNLYASLKKETDERNPLNRTLEVIKNNTNKNDTIYVVSNGYEFYPFSKRIPATIPLYLWYFSKYRDDINLKKAYDKVIDDITTNPPKLIIIATRDFFKKKEFNKLDQILNNNYKIAIIDSRLLGLNQNELFGFGKTFEYVEIYKKKE
jgi:hypothetical protein